MKYTHIFKSIISSDLRSLSELNIELIKTFSAMLSLNTSFHVASSIDNMSTDRVQRLVDLCQTHKCSSYYSPAGSLDYLGVRENKALFKSADISIYFQQFEAIPYSQRGKEFESRMSILDALMYCGPKKTKKIITHGSNILKLK